MTEGGIHIGLLDDRWEGYIEDYWMTQGGIHIGLLHYRGREAYRNTG